MTDVPVADDGISKEARIPRNGGAEFKINCRKDGKEVKLADEGIITIHMWHGKITMIGKKGNATVESDQIAQLIQTANKGIMRLFEDNVLTDDELAQIENFKSKLVEDLSDNQKIDKLGELTSIAKNMSATVRSK